MKLINIQPMIHIRRCAIILSLLYAGTLQAQDETQTIQPALQTLNIAPDARSSGMGEVGAATSPDINAQHWNAAKYAFMEDRGGVSLSYIPWLRQVANDVNIAYLTGYTRLPKGQSLSASLYFFSLGNISLYSDNADYLSEVKPREYAVDVAYARKFGDNFSAALTARYINSTLIARSGEVPYTTHANNFSVDMAAYWQHPVRLWNQEESQLAFGVTVSNLGTKLVTEDDTKYFLPMNLRLGGRLTGVFNSNNQLTFSLDVNKLLVPEDYKYNNESVIAASMHSFGDRGASIMTNLGLEYLLARQFAARAGFYAEANRMGGRRYLTFGAGASYRALTFDISYLTAVRGQDGVLSNTVKFSLLIGIKGNTTGLK